MSKIYMIEWEMVNPECAYEQEGVPNSNYTPDMWEKKPIVVRTTDPWDQYRTLKDWADRGVNGVRNVKLYKAKAIEPKWKEVKP